MDLLLQQANSIVDCQIHFFFYKFQTFIMAKINQNYQKLSAGYLFPEIARRTNLFLNENPGVQVMRLGIGDTTEPIVSSVIDGLHKGVDDLGISRKLLRVRTFGGH
jgi:hypothetical protein